MELKALHSSGSQDSYLKTVSLSLLSDEIKTQTSKTFRPFSVLAISHPHSFYFRYTLFPPFLSCQPSWRGKNSHTKWRLIRISKGDIIALTSQSHFGFTRDIHDMKKKTLRNTLFLSLHHVITSAS